MSYLEWLCDRLGHRKYFGEWERLATTFVYLCPCRKYVLNETPGD